MADTLRPRAWSEYIGQARLKHELEVHINAALEDDTPLDHVLLCAPPGAGKTSLAEIIAARLDEPLETVLMPITTRALVRLVQSYAGILLLDEVHRATPKQQEELLPLIEFGWVADATGRKVECGWLTVIAATTEPHKLIKPLYDRFTIRPEYDPYSDSDMAGIVLSMAGKVDIAMDEATALRFGLAAAGTPRRARQLVLNYRKLGLSLGRPPTCDEVLDFSRTGEDGLTSQHVRYLQTLKVLGGSKGLGIIATLMQLSESAVRELETLLLNKGYINFGDRGRELTQAGSARANDKEQEDTAQRRRPRRGAA